MLQGIPAHSLLCVDVGGGQLEFRELNLNWQHSLEVLSLLRSKEHRTGYLSGCKSGLCVLEPIMKPFWAPSTSFIRGTWEPRPSRVFHQEEDGESVFRKL